MKASSGAAQLFVFFSCAKNGHHPRQRRSKAFCPPQREPSAQFDFTPKTSLTLTFASFRTKSGRSVLQVRVPGSFTNKELNLVVPAGLVKPGKYTLVFTADPGSKGQPAKDEVLRLSFAIEFYSRGKTSDPQLANRGVFMSPSPRIPFHFHAEGHALSGEFSHPGRSLI